MREMAVLKKSYEESSTTDEAPQASMASQMGQADELRVARAGLTGNAGALPHLDQIQSSFGRHDVRNVQAYVGGAAADASATLGARAYATGGAVAFRQAPDLHTAAHEAAHVIQQRPGVHRKGADSESALERHADAVADRVVRGQSAELLLDQMVGRSDANAAVHFEGDPAPKPNMSDRHLLSKLNFWKGADKNSYLVKDVTDKALQRMYDEALKSGPKQGNVKLSNGQTWWIRQSDGKFFPVSGPGIVELTKQEVSLLRMLQGQLAKHPPSTALQNLSRAMSGQGVTVSSGMEAALEAMGRKHGFTPAVFQKALAANAPKTKTFDPPDEIKNAAKTKAGGRAFRILKWGGRIFLVVAIAADAYEIYEAENKAKTITKKAGAWGGGAAAGGVAATKASPLLAGGPWGWLAYGVVVGGAGVVGYIVGGEVTETIYEWTFE